MPCLKEKLKIAMKCVTLEPVVFFYMVSFMMNGLINQNLSLEKACRVNLGFNASVCDAMVLRNRSGYSFEEEVEVQLLVTKFATYRSFLLGSIPFFMLLFFGSWSDRYLRRKPLILIPTVGEIVGTAGVFVCSQLLLELPLEVSFVFEIMPTVLFGGMQCFFLGVFSYVSGLCTDEDRTFRIGTVSMCYPIGMSMGLFLSGFTLNRLGYRGAYTISISCMIFAFLYGFFMIKENSRQKTEEEKKIGFLRDIFDMKHITNTLNMFFKEKEEYKRMRMIVLMILIELISGPVIGENSVIYMYLRLKFGWNEVDYSIFNSVHFGIQMIGNSFSLTFFSKFLKLDDALLGIIAMTSKILGCLFYAFAPTGFYFYFGAVVEIFHSTNYIAVRAIMAKTVRSEDLGKSNSVFGICESIAPIIFGPLYAKVYSLTLTSFPGSFYLITTVMYAVAFLLFLWLYLTGKKEAKSRGKTVETMKSIELEA